MVEATGEGGNRRRRRALVGRGRVGDERGGGRTIRCSITRRTATQDEARSQAATAALSAAAHVVSEPGAPQAGAGEMSKKRRG